MPLRRIPESRVEVCYSLSGCLGGILTGRRWRYPHDNIVLGYSINNLIDILRNVFNRPVGALVCHAEYRRVKHPYTIATVNVLSRCLYSSLQLGIGGWLLATRALAAQAINFNVVGKALILALVTVTCHSVILECIGRVGTYVANIRYVIVIAFPILATVGCCGCWLFRAVTLTGHRGTRQGILADTRCVTVIDTSLTPH